MEFYKHTAMADGHLNKCKECSKTDVKSNRADKNDYYRGYDRNRAMNPERVQGRLEYSKTPNGKAVSYRANSSWRDNNPEKYKAETMVNNAIRDGKLLREKCRICGEKAHAHHPDYSKPFYVVWLCSKHHKAEHDLIDLGKPTYRSNQTA